MSINTSPAAHLQQLLNVEWPIIQAPMAGIQGSAMAVAVSNAGGLGSLPAAMLSPAALRQELQALATNTSKPYNINFFCHEPPPPDPAREQAWRELLAPYYEELGIDPSQVPASAGRQPFSAEMADVLEDFRPAVVSFHFGLPRPDLLQRVKAWGGTVLSSATTVQEAIWLAQHGADVVIAQGLEAGGHRGMFLTQDIHSQLGTLALVRQIVQSVSVPVVAAGGIADTQGVRAALAMGAIGVQVGTAYMLCDEASTSEVHRNVLQSEAARTTALTNLFSGRPARGVVNRLMRELGPLNDLAPAFPLATLSVAPLRTKAEAAGIGDFSPLWAGQNVSGGACMPAAEMTKQLTADLR